MNKCKKFNFFTRRQFISYILSIPVLVNIPKISLASNPFTLGSYASAEPGSFHLRKILRQSIGNRIFIAGEATAEEWATVAGATRSGFRAAKEVIKIL